jgi:hypothetical protein
MLGPLEWANLNRRTQQSRCLLTLTRGQKEIQFPKRYVFQLFRISDDGHNTVKKWFWLLYTIAGTPSMLFTRCIFMFSKRKKKDVFLKFSMEFVYCEVTSILLIFFLKLPCQIYHIGIVYPTLDYRPISLSITAMSLSLLAIFCSILHYRFLAHAFRICCITCVSIRYLSSINRYDLLTEI